MNIKEAIDIALSAKSAYEYINGFCRERYRDKFGVNSSPKIYHCYDGFELINKNEIKINYSYGAIGTDIEYSDSFIYYL